MKTIHSNENKITKIEDKCGVCVLVVDDNGKPYTVTFENVSLTTALGLQGIFGQMKKDNKELLHKIFVELF